MLDDVAAWMVGRIVERYDFGDHVGHLLEPVAGEVANAVAGSCGHLGDADGLEPGHPA